MKTTNHTNIIVDTRKMARIGWIIMLIGFIFAVIETAYFMLYLPETKAKLVCDVMTIMILGAGGSLFLYALTLHSASKIKYLRGQLKEMQVENKVKTYEPETKLRERALNNEFNCNAGAMQLLYTLAEADLLKEPYRSWAAGFEPTEGEELVEYNKAITDLEQSIILYNDQIKVEGKIIG